MEVFKTQYAIHLSTTSTVNRNTAKAALTQMVNAVFAKMDTYIRYGGQDTLDINKLYGGGNPISAQNSARSGMLSSGHSKASDGPDQLTTVTEESKDANSDANAGTA